MKKIIVILLAAGTLLSGCGTPETETLLETNEVKIEKTGAICTITDVESGEKVDFSKRLRRKSHGSGTETANTHETENLEIFPVESSLVIETPTARHIIK